MKDLHLAASLTSDKLTTSCHPTARLCRSHHHHAQWTPLASLVHEVKTDSHLEHWRTAGEHATVRTGCVVTTPEARPRRTKDMGRPQLKLPLG
jgi:hypothetical protein